MSRVCLFAILLIAAMESSAGAATFVTKDFAIVRKAPGPNYPLLTVIPPSTAVTVNSCSTYWSVGWCEVTYQGWTGSVHSSLLEVVGGPGGKGATGNLLRARKNYLMRQRAFEAARAQLKQLRRTQARKEKVVLAHTGQWVEPGAAWRKQVALQHKVSRLGKSANRARGQFFNAAINAPSAARAHEDKTGSIWSSLSRW